MSQTEVTNAPRVTIGPKGVAGLLIASAVLMGLSFPRPNLWLLSYLALVPMSLAALRAGSIGWLAGISFVTGWAWWLIMIRWMIPVTLPGHIAVSAYMGSYWTGYLLVFRAVDRRWGRPAVITVPLLWVGFEYLRGTLLTGFPWFNLAHSQPIVVIQIADVVGSFGVSFLVAAVNGALIDLLIRPLVDPKTRRWGPGVKLSMPVAAGLMVVTCAYGMWRLGYEPEDAAIRIAIVQTNVPQSNKVHPTDEQDRANFEQMMKLTAEAIDANPDLIVWPETMVPRPLNEESIAMYRKLYPPYVEYYDTLTRFAREREVALLVGAHAMEGWPAYDPKVSTYRPTHRYNAAYLIDPTGQVAERFDKVHRVPFGEYIPWVESIPPLKRLLLNLTPYETDYTLRPGEKLTRFETHADGHAWRFATPICFEDVVNYLPRQMVMADGRKQLDLLINISNDGWFAGTAQGPQHEQIARFRCVENRVPMARAVNTGSSSWIDSSGRVLKHIVVDGRTQQVAGVGTVELHRDGRTSVFGRIGNVLPKISLAVTGCLTVVLIAMKLKDRKRT